MTMRKKWPQNNFRYYAGICLEGQKKTTKNLSPDNQSLGHDLNLKPPKYEAELYDVRFSRQ
jgi:hypothetical protein